MPKLHEIFTTVAIVFRRYERLAVLQNVFAITQEKNNGFPLLDILGYLNNTHKHPKFSKVRQVPTREFPTRFPDWDLSHSCKFGIFVGILQIP